MHRLIANLHAASYKAMQDAQTAQAPRPRASRASSRQPAGHVPAGIGRGCRTLLSAAGSGYTGICRPTPDTVAKKAQETVPQRPSDTYSAKTPPPYEPPAYVPAASAPEPHPVYDQPSPAVNPYRQPAPDTTATLPALDATASQPEPETAYHQASPLPYNPPQETDKYIPVNEMESSSFLPILNLAEEQESKRSARSLRKAIEAVPCRTQGREEEGQRRSQGAKVQKKATGAAASP